MQVAEQRSKLKRLVDDFNAFGDSATKEMFKEKRLNILEKFAVWAEAGLPSAVELMQLTNLALAAEAKTVAAEAKTVALQATPFTVPLPPIGVRHNTVDSPHVHEVIYSVQCQDGVVRRLEGLSLCTLFVSYALAKKSRDFTSETDVAVLVASVLEDCATALNLGGMLTVDIKVQHEPALSHLYPDVVLFQMFSLIGLCEVKKPSLPNKNIFTEGGVYSQVFSYLRLLRTYYGIRWCFCILSTYVEWAVFYLDDCKSIAEMESVADVDAASRRDQEAIDLVEPKDEEATFNTSTICISTIHSKPAEPSPTLVRSNVVRFDDPNLAYYMAATMYKMAKSPRNRVLSLDGDRLMVTPTSAEWKPLPRTAEVVRLNDFVNADVRAIYLLRSLGEGAEGKCFLACDAIGRTCVTKLYKKSHGGLQAVVQNWQTVFGIDCIAFSSSILLIPFFHAVNWNAGDNKTKYRAGVIDALRKLAAAHRIHTDLRWDHVMLRDFSSSEVVVVDLNCRIVSDRDEEQLLSEMMSTLQIE